MLEICLFTLVKVIVCTQNVNYFSFNPTTQEIRFNGLVFYRAKNENSFYDVATKKFYLDIDGNKIFQSGFEFYRNPSPMVHIKENK